LALSELSGSRQARLLRYDDREQDAEQDLTDDEDFASGDGFSDDGYDGRRLSQPFALDPLAGQNAFLLDRGNRSGQLAALGRALADFLGRLHG
jgi:hypothetical protein